MRPRGVLPVIGLLLAASAVAWAIDLRDMPPWMRDMIRPVYIDWQQVAYEQMAWPRPNLDAPSLDDHQIVVEIKADGAAHQRVSDLLTRFPLRTERHSKYVGSVLSALS